MCVLLCWFRLLLYINHFMFWGSFPIQRIWIQCSIFMIAEKSSYTLKYVHVIIFGIILCYAHLLLYFVSYSYEMILFGWYFHLKNYDRMHCSNFISMRISNGNEKGEENANDNEKQKQSNHTLYYIYVEQLQFASFFVIIHWETASKINCSNQQRTR